MSEFKDAFIRLRSQGPGREWLVPQELRGKIVADAEEKGTNITDIALGILSRRFKIPLIASGRKSSPKDDEDVILLRLPWDLYLAVYGAAINNRRSYIDEIRATLCAHYGLRFARIKRTRRPRAAAA